MSHPDNTTFAQRKAAREADTTPPKPRTHKVGFRAGRNEPQPEVIFVDNRGGDRVERIDKLTDL